MPTAEEAGLKDFNVSTWFGLFATRDTPPAIVDKLNSEVREVFKTPRFVEYLNSRGATATPVTAPEFKQFFHSEVALWANVVKDAKIKFE